MNYIKYRTPERELANERFIATKNGVIDIKEDRLLEHNPNLVLINKINASYKRGVYDENVVRFFKTITEEEEMYTPLGFDISDRNQLVFPNTVNGYLQLNKTNYWIKRIQRENNLKEITTHGLRHTHCTLLFEAGASLQEVQDRLGHSDSQTTYNIYTHITAEGQKKAVDSFSEFMKI